MHQDIMQTDYTVFMPQKQFLHIRCETFSNAFSNLRQTGLVVVVDKQKELTTK